MSCRVLINPHSYVLISSSSLCVTCSYLPRRFTAQLLYLESGFPALDTPYGSSYTHRTIRWCPDPDGTLIESVRIKIRHYRNVCLNRPDPIVFLPLTVDTTDRLYDDCLAIELSEESEASALAIELSEESDQFRFLPVVCFANLKGAVGLIMVKASVIRISIPLDLSPRSFIPLPRFIRSRRPTPLLTPSILLFPPRST